MTARQLEGKVALITGAGQGIGAGIARILAERGASVCLLDVDEEAAKQTEREMAASGHSVIALTVDVRSPGQMQRAAETVLARFGQLDICVPNAGVIAAAGFESREYYTAEDWEATRDTNVLGVVNTVDAVKGPLVQQRSGKIVIVSSQGGREPRGASLPLGSAIVPYLVSKAATIQLTHHLAIELGQYNINVNAVCPGTVWTPMWERIARNRMAAVSSLQDRSPRELFEQALQTRHPIAREQTPADIGRAVAFLASDDAAQITGQALNVNGGAVLN